MTIRAASNQSHVLDLDRRPVPLSDPAKGCEHRPEVTSFPPAPAATSKPPRCAAVPEPPRRASDFASGHRSVSSFHKPARPFHEPSRSGLSSPSPCINAAARDLSATRSSSRRQSAKASYPPAASQPFGHASKILLFRKRLNRSSTNRNSSTPKSSFLSSAGNPFLSAFETINATAPSTASSIKSRTDRSGANSPSSRSIPATVVTFRPNSAVAPPGPSGSRPPRRDSRPSYPRC